jgi:hypothetical protein
MIVTRQHVIDILQAAGLPRAADQVTRSLPDPVAFDEAAEFLERHGITKDMLISRVGGSP